jgi:hypothetical protein
MFHRAAKYLDDGHTGWFVPEKKSSKRLRKSRINRSRKEDYKTGSGVEEVFIDETRIKTINV